MIQYGVGFTSDWPWPTSAVPHTPRYPEDLQNEDTSRTAWALSIMSCQPENCHQLHNLTTLFVGFQMFAEISQGCFFCSIHIHLSIAWHVVGHCHFVQSKVIQMMRMAPWIFGVPVGHQWEPVGGPSCGYFLWSIAAPQKMLNSESSHIFTGNLLFYLLGDDQPAILASQAQKPWTCRKSQKFAEGQPKNYPELRFFSDPSSSIFYIETPGFFANVDRSGACR